jgi:hypothetical protein
MIGVPGTHGMPEIALASDTAQPDFGGQAAATSGTYSQGKCVCAINGLAGGSGNRGNVGSAGMPGQAPPTVGFIVGRLLSDIAVHSVGGAGGRGGQGSHGQDGGDGQDSGVNDTNCLKVDSKHTACCPPATGGVGGDAGRGGDGGPGGAGGNGGDIYVCYLEHQGGVYQVLSASIAGAVGPGGAPGNAGTPGQGGTNESGTTPRADSGATNGPGGTGSNGTPPGQPGRVTAFSLAT